MKTLVFFMMLHVLTTARPISSSARHTLGMNDHTTSFAKCHKRLRPVKTAPGDVIVHTVAEKFPFAIPEKKKYISNMKGPEKDESSSRSSVFTPLMELSESQRDLYNENLPNEVIQQATGVDLFPMIEYHYPPPPSPPSHSKVIAGVVIGSTAVAATVGYGLLNDSSSQPPPPPYEG